MRYTFLFLLFSLSLVCACQQKKKKEVANSFVFDFGTSKGQLDNAQINEASGLDASLVNPYKFWTHNDSGGEAELFLIDNKAHYVARVQLAGLENRDWEEISTGPGPDSTKSYVYVGEIGDNQAKYAFKYIYRFEEPVLIEGEVKTITDIDLIKFQLPDGQRDTESFFIDQSTKDIYIFSKREKEINLYTLPFPQSTDTISTARYLLTLPLTQLVAADYESTTGELLLKNYESIYYWKKQGSESILDLLKNKAQVLPYKPEPQGEAICFSPDGTGYFTLSEEVKGKKPHLLFYPRKK